MSGGGPLPEDGGVPATARLKAIRRRAHPRCVVCSPANPMGLGQEFSLRADGGVEGTFAARDVFEGYSGLLHGGVTAALLDGAMTNCLFARGVEALTAELTVRYRGPIALLGEIAVRAWLTASRGRLRLLRAELRQGDRLKATAVGKFVESHG
ncbi:MAG: PaaI family thioesterase [Verrucomicrobiae bacterium]|nr:PaaI family thioesterase [Verrucomicrobiae bacterium]